VKNTGNSSVTVSQIAVTGTGFSVISGVTGTTIAAGQTAQMSVVFAPRATGSVTGRVTITSNATNSPNSVTTAGTGVSGTAHSAALSWGASSSSGIAGYNVYRSTTPGASFVRINSALLTALKYTDGTVASGQTYYYAVTAVSSVGAESTYSGQVTANIP
jgi:fibronectin type 3 domain-containing protein